MTEVFKITTYRDDMLQMMINQIRFNRYDMKFMQNILVKYIAPGESLSQNQNDLYEKLIHKYRKQFRKLNANYKQILSTKWKHGVILNEELKHQTFFRLADVDDEVIIELYFNFDKKKIEKVRAIVHDDDCNYLNRGVSDAFLDNVKYDFTWDNETKMWSGKFNVQLFKELYRFACMNDLEIDKSVIDLINRMKITHGPECNWQSQIILIDDRMYINNIAESMLPFLDKIDMTDTSIQNIEKITALGVMSPECYGDINQFINCASKNTANEISSKSDFRALQNYIEASERKVILFNPVHFYTRQRKQASNTWNLIEALQEWKHPQVKQITTHDFVAKETIAKWMDEGYVTFISTQDINSLVSAQHSLGTFSLAADKTIVLQIQNN